MQERDISLDLVTPMPVTAFGKEVDIRWVLHHNTCWQPIGKVGFAITFYVCQKTQAQQPHVTNYCTLWVYGYSHSLSLRLALSQPLTTQQTQAHQGGGWFLRASTHHVGSAVKPRYGHRVGYRLTSERIHHVYQSATLNLNPVCIRRLPLSRIMYLCRYAKNHVF